MALYQIQDFCEGGVFCIGGGGFVLLRVRSTLLVLSIEVHKISVLGEKRYRLIKVQIQDFCDFGKTKVWCANSLNSMELLPLKTLVHIKTWLRPYKPELVSSLIFFLLLSLETHTRMF